MKRGLTGRYEVTGVMGEEVRAFVPHPLPPNPPLELTNQRQRLLERATLALGRLDSISLLLPDPDLFLYAYVRREAVLSSQIEGTQSSLAQLLLFEIEDAPGVPLDDVVEVSNYVAALDHGLRRLQGGFPLSNRLIREMHGVLLARGRGSDKSPGEFRRSQNWIGGTRPGNAHFVPPPPDRVAECMAALERFLHGEGNPYPALIKAALAHVQFETIHPFLDGNGRVGRLLIAFVLHHDGVLSQPLLYLSLYFKQHRAEYYRLLDLVRTDGDWEAWIDFFLEGVQQTASNAVETARRLVALFQQDEQRIQAMGRRASTALRVFRVFCERPLMNLTQMCERTGLSFAAAANAVKEMEEAGILREITGQRRNRVFTYEQYLAILSEGTEPL
ncbi:Fic family protein [Litorilinea aerophila]|uniref:Fic family protein n=1 Tax=Litorilinea aerophila TaxID=1204385 RepID=A0A540VJU9_9CHLR|nr:Fic family protein [Litorilinea aerophila]MCC9075535.1 Fic family protein [Litorilinea aerophila]OUC08969.1 cell division protein Fic [Litorilinea aerophila]